MKARRTYALVIQMILLSCLANPREARAVPVPSDYEVVSVPLDIGARHCWVNPGTNRIYASGLSLSGTQWRLYCVDGETLTVTGEIDPAGSGSGVMVLDMVFSVRHGLMVASRYVSGHQCNMLVLDANTEQLLGDYPVGDEEGIFQLLLLDDIGRLLLISDTADGEALQHYDLRVFSLPSMQEIAEFEDTVVRWVGWCCHSRLMGVDYKRHTLFLLGSEGDAEDPDQVWIDVFDANALRFERRVPLHKPPGYEDFDWTLEWPCPIDVLEASGTAYGSVCFYAGTSGGYFYKIPDSATELQVLEESTRPVWGPGASANNVTDRAYFSPPLWYMQGDTEEPHRVGGGDLYPGVDVPLDRGYRTLKINQWTNTLYAYESLDSSCDYVDIYDGKNETWVRIDLGRTIYDGCIDTTRHRAYFVCSNDIDTEGYLVAVIPIDPDGDGLVRGDEDLNDNGVLDPGESDPNLYDTDGDGINDGYERGRMTDPSNPDTDGDGLTDLQEDPNINLLLDPGETDPLDPDCDGDGVLDGDDPWPWDAEWSTDADSDGLPDEWELFFFGSLDQGPDDDYDGDGCDNYTEWKFGADPTDNSSYVPAMLTAGMLVLIALLTGTVAQRRTAKRTKRVS